MGWDRCLCCPYKRKIWWCQYCMTKPHLVLVKHIRYCISATSIYVTVYVSPMEQRYICELFPPKSKQVPEQEEGTFEKYKELTSKLPIEMEGTEYPMRLYQGFWHLEFFVPPIMALQDHFKPLHDDILVTSYPKCGTTWLKSLVYSIVTRHKHPFSQHPLLAYNPHGCVYQLEDLYMTRRLPDWERLPSPRLLGTHVSYFGLPPSVRGDVTPGGCRIIYICREPKDNFTALWYAQKRLKKEGEEMMLPLDVSVDVYCQGKYGFGSIWEHMLDYWMAHKTNPGKVYFLKYEELVKDTNGVVKSLAEFMGYSFSEEEEERGVIEKIVQLCSLENMTKQEVNKVGKIGMSFMVENKTFFRVGKIGDWVNLLTNEMAKKIDMVTNEKLEGTGLSFHD